MLVYLLARTLTSLNFKITQLLQGLRELFAGYAIIRIRSNTLHEIRGTCVHFVVFKSSYRFITGGC